MKAILLTDHFGEGGAERVASLVIKALIKAKAELHVCVFEDDFAYDIDKQRLTIHILADKDKSHFVNSFIKFKNLIKVMRKERPQVIFSFGPIMASYVYIAKLLSGHKKMKVVSSERNDPRYEPVENWKKRIRNFCYNRADVLVCQTPMASDILEKEYGVECKKVIIPNPITPNLPVWHGEQSKEIITAARLTEQKNLPLLIRAFARIHNEHPEMRLTIYGKGELKDDLIHLASILGKSEAVSFPGFAHDIHSIMASAYMYVSCSDYEGISNSMLESLGIGLPIVCTDCPVGGAAMYINDGENGLLIPVNDENRLYEAMKYLIENPDVAKQFSKESRRINEDLRIDRITQEWLKLI